MSENRDIEQRLRDYGKKRRDESGSSPELHPATRRLLQGAVARVHASAKSTQPGPAVGWRSNWARFGLAISLLVGLGVATVLLLKVENPAEKSVQLTRSPDNILSAPADEPATSGQLAQQAAPAGRVLDRETIHEAAPAAPSPLYLRDDATVALNDAPKLAGAKDMGDNAHLLLPTKQKVEARIEPVQRIPGPPTVQPPGAAAFNKQSVDQLQRTAEKTVSAATAPLTLPEFTVAQNQAAPMAPLTTLSAQAPALTRQWEEGGKGTFDGQFMNTAGMPGSAGQDKDNLQRSAGAGSSNDVLSGFQFSYADGEVRVTDQDGSVYAGRAVPTTTATDELSLSTNATPQASRRSGSAPVRLRGAGSAVVSRKLSFEVVGTNRTLNQMVSFNGVIAPVSELRETDVSKQVEDAAKKTTNEAARRPAPRVEPRPTREAIPRTRPETPSTSSVAVVVGGALTEVRAGLGKERTNSPMQIRGRVKVGNNRDLPVDAVPVTPFPR